jgi:hypothetical protein
MIEGDRAAAPVGSPSSIVRRAAPPSRGVRRRPDAVAPRGMLRPFFAIDRDPSYGEPRGSHL